MKYAIPTAITAGVLTLGLAWQPAMGEAGQASAYPDVEIDPQLDPRGELLQPRGFRTWVFIGAPLTPNALNDGAAGFPELHTSMSATLAASAMLMLLAAATTRAGDLATEAYAHYVDDQGSISLFQQARIGAMIWTGTAAPLRVSIRVASI